MNSNLRDYHFLFLRLMQEVVSCTPKEWGGGVFTISRNSEDIKCSIRSKIDDRTVSPSQDLLSLCDSFLEFKKENSRNDWVKVSIQYSIDESSGDFSTDDGSFEYPLDSPFIHSSKNDTPETAFWREQTRNDVWKKSPSLLVIEFILDYELLLNTQKNQDFSKLHIKSEIFQDIIHKFSYSEESLAIEQKYFDYEHNIYIEAVKSVESQKNKSLVITNLKNGKKGIDISINYILEFRENRWFLSQILLREANS